MQWQAIKYGIVYWGMVKLNAVNAIFGSKISDYHGQYGMNHFCHRERTERIAVFKDLNEKWKRYANFEIFAAAKPNEIKRFLYIYWLIR